ncbi:MAG TPA: hypothetical protein VHK63_03835 [Candidatus Limnocylindria bacterium]|nr:hypothetical protein [Candidatus Limnocylindria bacterium]
MPNEHELRDNQGVLRYIAQGGDPATVTVKRPPEDVDRWRLGADPAVVGWLWDELNAVLPGDGRRLVGATAALVEPESGLLVAVALGTQYALRLSGQALPEAVAKGYVSVHHFRTVGRTLNLRESFGEGWVFGAMDAREPAWLASSLKGIAG